jgi:hypothetical protein
MEAQKCNTASLPAFVRVGRSARDPVVLQQLAAVRNDPFAPLLGRSTHLSYVVFAHPPGPGK